MIIYMSHIPIYSITSLEDPKINHVNALMNSGHDAFFRFHSQNCGHCIAMSNDWESFEKSLNDSNPKVSGVIVVSITPAPSERLNSFNKVAGYPTLAHIKKDRKISEFNGERTEQKFKEFLDMIIASRRSTMPIKPSIRKASRKMRRSNKNKSSVIRNSMRSMRKRTTQRRKKNIPRSRSVNKLQKGGSRKRLVGGRRRKTFRNCYSTTNGYRSTKRQDKRRGFVRRVL